VSGVSMRGHTALPFGVVITLLILFYYYLLSVVFT